MAENTEAFKKEFIRKYNKERFEILKKLKDADKTAEHIYFQLRRTIGIEEDIYNDSLIKNNINEIINMVGSMDGEEEFDSLVRDDLIEEYSDYDVDRLVDISIGSIFHGSGEWMSSEPYAIYDGDFDWVIDDLKEKLGDKFDDIDNGVLDRFENILANLLTFLFDYEDPEWHM